MTRKQAKPMAVAAPVIYALVRRKDGFVVTTSHDGSYLQEACNPNEHVVKYVPVIPAPARPARRRKGKR